MEVEPLFVEPDLERAVMICERCKRAVENARHRVEPEELRFLMETVWHETLPIQLVSVRVLQRLSSEGVMWAMEVMEGLYLDPKSRRCSDLGIGRRLGPLEPRHLPIKKAWRAVIQATRDRKRRAGLTGPMGSCIGG